MAVSQTPIQGPTVTPPSPNRGITDLIATLDADTGLVFPHGMAGIPQEFQVIPFGPDEDAGKISDWGVTAVDATNITLAKTIDAGSGAVGVQARLTFKLPHSVNG